MGFVSSLVRDVTFALRQMRQTPIVSGVALLSLALGIGANVAIFSLVNALILKPLPVYEPDRLVILGFEGIRGPNTSLTNPQWEYIRDHQQVLVGVAAYGNPRFNLNTSGETRNAQGLFVSGRFFDTLGVTPHIGRLFSPDDDRRLPHLPKREPEVPAKRRHESHAPFDERYLIMVWFYLRRLKARPDQVSSIEQTL